MFPYVSTCFPPILFGVFAGTDQVVRVDEAAVENQTVHPPHLGLSCLNAKKKTAG